MAGNYKASRMATSRIVRTPSFQIILLISYSKDEQ